MKSRSVAKKRARKRKGCPANDVRRHHRQSMMAVSTSQEAGEPSVEEAGEPRVNEAIFKPLKNIRSERLGRPSSICSSSLLRHKNFVKFVRHQSSLAIKYGLAPATGNSIMNLSCLNTALSKAVICSKCRDPKSELVLVEDKRKRKGFAQSFVLLCNKCPEKTTFFSSAPKWRKSFDINVQAVHASCQGHGLSGLQKLAGILDLPSPVSKKPYNKILKTLSSTSMVTQEKVLNESGKFLREEVALQDPCNIVEVNIGKSVAKVAVSIDGT